MEISINKTYFVGVIRFNYPQYFQHNSMVDQ